VIIPEQHGHTAHRHVLREQQQQQKERKEKYKSITGQRKTVREMNE
jgi:hypothetical protein